jgi:hypothetical protein
MSQFVNRARPWRVAALAAIALAALPRVWMGRATADDGTDAVAKTVSNIATGRADAVDASTALSQCTSSASFTAMPQMSETFSFGGNASRPVLVLFHGEWVGFAEGAFVTVRLTIDGVVQSGPGAAGDLVLAFRPAGEPFQSGTHGFNFVSEPLAPGTHTATIQWQSAGGGQVCVDERSLIVLHK